MKADGAGHDGIAILEQVVHFAKEQLFSVMHKCIFSCLLLVFFVRIGAMMDSINEPNPPHWPDSVKIFRDTDDPTFIAKELEASQDPWIGNDDNTFTCENHFSRNRTALLFAPGQYHDLRFEIGYYVQLAGLGSSAEDVTFVGGGPYVPALNKHLHKRSIHDESGEIVQEVPVGTSLDTFWRSAENFAMRGNMVWAVSQAAPLRRIHVTGDLYLHDGPAYASGGHLANAVIDGTVHAGGQQQFLLRNVQLSKSGSKGGAWSMVFAGCSGNVPEAFPGTHRSASITIVDRPRVRIEKPYIAMKSDRERFELRVPRAMQVDEETNYSIEPDLFGHFDEIREFTRVCVVRESEAVTRIQEALDHGKDVVLTPGIYSLEKTIEIRHPGQALLGLGLATLEAPADGSPCIHVTSGIPGVRIAGIMLEATENTDTVVSSSTLLQWGEQESFDPGDKNDPGAMFDIFIRVGGSTAGDRSKYFVECMMKIFSGNVAGDNLWIWRADHSIIGEGESANYPHISPVFMQTEQHEYRAESGLVVRGDDVTIFGLAVEHANGHQTIWSGERGLVVFYQCEFPYGVTKEFAENEFRGYKVEKKVEEHEVYAPGIYSNFRNDVVYVSTAIEYPEKPGMKVINPFSVMLDNRGGIKSIANGRGRGALMKGLPVRMIV